MKTTTQEKYHLEKSLWTAKDFEKMGWHDCIIYAWCLNEKFELVLDIDYLFHWIPPTNQRKYYKFWISPCTLVFENVYDLKFDLEISEPYEVKINDIHRENPQRPRNANFSNFDTEYYWIIDSFQGQISFKSIGYKLFVRKQPILLRKQKIGIKKRNGISFNKRSIRI
jgi:hypothetical protein